MHAAAAFIGPSTKLFPANADLALHDAALPWSNPADAAASMATPLDRKFFFDRPSAPALPTVHPITPIAGKDLDVLPMGKNAPSFYSNAGFSGLSPDVMDAPAVVGANLETEMEDFSTRNTAVVMAQIETDRIPCPRLCGASFSSGVGGIAGSYSVVCHIVLDCALKRLRLAL